MGAIKLYLQTNKWIANYRTKASKLIYKVYNESQMKNYEELVKVRENIKNEVMDSSPNDNQAEEAHSESVQPRPINNELDAFYYLAAMNLLNTYVKLPEHERDFYINYSFKGKISSALEQIILKVPSVEVYIDKGIIYVYLLEFQFSFHNVNLNSFLENYRDSADNKFQEWKAVKLQPYSSMIFNAARNLLGLKPIPYRSKPKVATHRTDTVRTKKSTLRNIPFDNSTENARFDEVSITLEF